MRHFKTWLGLIILAFLLAACSTPAVAPAATAIPASPTAVPATATAVPATATAVPASPTPANTPTEMVAIDNCVTCHTDKDQLILTAKLEEEVPQESEGAG